MRKLILALTFLFLVACQLPHGSRPGEDEMLSTKVMKVPSREIIWEWIISELRNTDFRLAREQSDMYEGSFESQWMNLPSSHRFQGIRKKIVGRLREEEGAPGEFRVLLSVWQQRNADIENPWDTSRGIWQDKEPDLGLAELLIYRIECRYGD